MYILKYVHMYMRVCIHMYTCELNVDTQMLLHENICQYVRMHLWKCVYTYTNETSVYM